MKTLYVSLVSVSVILSIFSTGYAYKQCLKNDALISLNKLGAEEIRILTYELNEVSRKPTYEEGYKAALIRSGGPSGGGLYQEGFDDAQKLFQNEGYQTGYHNAISQFGYQKPNTSRYLAPEPIKEKEDIQTTKVGKL